MSLSENYGLLGSFDWTNNLVDGLEGDPPSFIAPAVLQDEEYVQSSIFLYSTASLDLDFDFDTAALNEPSCWTTSTVLPLLARPTSESESSIPSDEELQPIIIPKCVLRGEGAWVE
jgi:hypothetical protein